MSEQNKRLMRRAVEEIWNRGQIALVEELFASDWAGHWPTAEIHGREGFKEFIAAQRRLFPSLRYTIEDLIAEGDRVAIRWSFQEEPPSRPSVGRTVIAGITIARIADCRFVEAWTVGASATEPLPVSEEHTADG